MWTEMTCSPALGDTFALEYKSLVRPVYVKSGQTCTDYTSPHAATGAPIGAEGSTGQDYVEQYKYFERVQPLSFTLEMVSNALYTNNGAEVEAYHNLLTLLNSLNT